MRTFWALALFTIVLAAPSWSQDNDGGYVDRPHSESNENWVNKDHGTTREDVPAKTEKSVQTAPIVIKGRDGKNGKNGRDGRTTVRILREFRAIPAKPRVPGYFVEDYRKSRDFLYGLPGYISRSETRTQRSLDGLREEVKGLKGAFRRFLRGDPDIHVRPGDSSSKGRQLMFPIPSNSTQELIPDQYAATLPLHGSEQNRLAQSESTAEVLTRIVYFRADGEPVGGVKITCYRAGTDAIYHEAVSGPSKGGYAFDFKGDDTLGEYDFEFELPQGYTSVDEGQRIPLNLEVQTIEVQKESQTTEGSQTPESGQVQPANPSTVEGGNSGEQSPEKPPPAEEKAPKAEQKPAAPDIGGIIGGWFNTILTALFWICVAVITIIVMGFGICKFFPWLFKTSKEKDWGPRSRASVERWREKTRRNWAEAGEASRQAQERRRRQADAAAAAYDPVKMREEAARVRVPMGTPPADDTRTRYLDGGDGDLTPPPFMASAPPPGSTGGTG